MKPLFHHSSSILLFFYFYAVSLLMISIIDIPTCMCDDGDKYTNCNTAFTCEGSSIANSLNYPFWGVNREKYCGSVSDPNMELTCEDKVLKITINSVTYRILEWDDSIVQKLTVARDDYWNDICATSDNHKNSTFDNTLFQRDVGGSGSANLTLLYDCNTKLPNMFYSATCDNNIKVVYTLADPASITCAPTFIVGFPITGVQVAQLLTQNDVNQALEGGFDLKWNGNYTQCQVCIASHGACGNDKGKFRCFCEDGAHTTSCTSATVSSSKSK
ncbi:hypothetical protein TSUD_158800 [Trifolium subterraneum]|uniref:Wall-associated receptor kinase C-terminal domain-containing protein n=1 Tax=Trifolium subterraneum TaxID=3900 RepID=A0A2Z6P4Y3_TRISU|nr:hypothetical protein TSUD_158800 [Trifolium subterraneum]